MRGFMRRLRKQFRYGEKGFTLIELLVVVAILGVLAAVAIPAVAGFIGRGETEANLTEKDNVQLAVTAAMADCEQGTVDTPGTLSSTSDVTVCTGITVGKYLLGGNASLKCSYEIDGTGGITSQTCP